VSRRCIVLLALLGLALVSLGSACSPSQGKREQVTLQLNWYHAAEFAGFYMAEAKGYYREANIDSRILEGGPGIAARDYIFDGRADFALASFDEQRNFILAGRPAVAVMTDFQIPPLVMFALADSGIKQPSDLVGRRVGIKNNYWRNVARTTLAHAGVDPAGMIEVDVPADAQDMLYDHQVDVWMGYAHDEAVKAEMAGYQINKIFPSEYGVGGYEGLLLVSEDTINQKPDMVGRFARASQRGLQYAVEHPDEAAQVLVQKQPKENLEYYQRAMRILGLLVDTPQIKTGEIDPVRWADLLGNAYDVQRPGYSMRFLENN
jgi:ABC-type nitrate/sulfonate/bicarbonate transport system substrate-binding protein